MQQNNDVSMRKASKGTGLPGTTRHRPVPSACPGHRTGGEVEYRNRSLHPIPGPHKSASNPTQSPTNHHHTAYGTMDGFPHPCCYACLCRLPAIHAVWRRHHKGRPPPLFGKFLAQHPETATQYCQGHDLAFHCGLSFWIFLVGFRHFRFRCGGFGATRRGLQQQKGTRK